MEKLYIKSAKTRPGADCVSDHELLIAKLRLKLKKVGKTNRAFRYDLNQFPYAYTLQVINRFKGLDLVDRVPEELWKKIHKEVQWLSEEALQIAEERREAKSKGERERYSQLNSESQRIARRDKKAFLNEQCKEVEENNRMRKTRDHQEY